MNHKKETYKFLATKISELSVNKMSEALELNEALEVCRKHMEPDITELYVELGLKG